MKSDKKMKKILNEWVLKEGTLKENEYDINPDDVEGLGFDFLGLQGMFRQIWITARAIRQGKIDDAISYFQQIKPRDLQEFLQVLIQLKQHTDGGGGFDSADRSEPTDDPDTY